MILLIFIGYSSFSQTDICEEAAVGVFWPVKIGVKRHYYAGNSSYVSYFNGDSSIFSGHVYYKRIEEYSNNDQKVRYVREQKGNVYIYDTEKSVEFLELSGNVTPGHIWEKYDKSWKYTVVDTISTITTPYCEYKNLLNIKAEPQNKNKEEYLGYYNLYYKRGVGLVNLSVNGKGYSFLSMDKSLVDERSHLMIGCETLESENERIQCTSEKVNDFISKNFNYDGKIKKGKIILQFAINRDGKVEDITTTQTIKKAEGQLQEAIRVLKMITFIPRKINGKPTKTYVALPVSF